MKHLTHLKHLKHLAIILAAIGIVSTLLPAAASAAPGRAWSCYRYSALERAFALKTNKARAQHGLPKLNLDPQLSKTSSKHTFSMAHQDRLFHTTNSQFYNRVTSWSTLGENVGEGGDVGSLQRAFMHSPEHRANILERKYSSVGVGVVRSHGRMWVTVQFSGGGNPGTTLRKPSC